MKKIIFLFCLILFSFKTEHQEVRSTGLITTKAMVVSAREEASKIGVEIMRRGGNAFDAMVATELALAVAYPYAGNIGGGGFMVYRKANGEIGGIDYREKAPIAASKNMYLDSAGNVIEGKSTKGAMAVGVPVITTTVGGNPELITHEADGFLVGYNNKEELIAAIEAVSDMTVAKRKQLIGVARERAQGFTQARMLEDTADLLKSL